MWFTPLLGGGQQQLPEVPGILRLPNTLALQPQTAPQIDWRNPITKNLLTWQTGNFLNGFTPVNAPGTVFSHKGILKTFTSASSQYLVKDLEVSYSNTPCTIVALSKKSALGSAAIVCLANTAANESLQLTHYINSITWLTKSNSGGGGNETGYGPQDLNWHVHVGVVDNTGIMRYYQDGRKGGNYSDQSGAGTFNRIVIGGRYWGGYDTFYSGEIGLVLVFKRAFTVPEVKSISENPWQVFQAPEKRIFIFPGLDITTRPSADVSRVIDTPIFRKPRIKRLPSSATPLNLSHPILRGLEQGVIAGPFRNATSRNAYTVRTSTPKPAPFGTGEKLAGSTGYISAPTTNTLGTDSWTSIVYAVVPNTNACALTLVAESPGSTISDKGLHISSTGKVVAGLYDVAGGGSSQFVSSVASVVPGVPFLAAAIGTSSSVNCWLDNNKVSGVVNSSGYANFSTPEYVVGYGTFNNNNSGTASEATIAYALKLNRAITDAEWRSLVQDPWQIFQQVEKPTTVHRAPDADIRKTPLFFTPNRKKFPSDATPLNLGHPILRGLAQGVIAGPLRNATTRNRYTVRTSIPAPAPFGIGEALSGSTGYISAPTVANSSTAPWTFIVYGVVPSIGANCALLGTASSPGDGTYDRSVSLSASGAVQARIFNPSPYSYAQATTTTKTVTPGVPFLAGAVATGSELIAYLDYNKVSAAAPTAGYPYGSPVLVAGYGGPLQTTSSNATIAYALKLDRAITDAEWASLVQDPWQIFMPGQKRVISLPTLVSPWTANLTNDALYDDVNETSTNDRNYIISSRVPATVTGDPVIFKLDKNLPEGLHTVRARAKKSETIGEIRASLLDNNNLEVGTSAWQPLSNSFRTYDLAVVARDSASRVKFETIAYSVPSIVLDGLVLHLDATNPISYPGSGTTWTDLSGNGNNGTLNGATFTPNNGGSIVFDGVDDYVDIPPISFTGPFTISGFVYRQSTTGAQVFFGEDSGYSGGGPKIAFNTIYNQMSFRILITSNSITCPVVQTWIFVAITRDSGNKVDVYLNASAPIRLYADVAQGGTFTFNKLGANGQDLSQPLNGRIAQVSAYNRTLSAAEIAQNYNALKSRFITPTSIVTEGLILNLDATNPISYPGSGTTWTDLSGNGNNMTIAGSPTYSMLQGFTFDGTVGKYIIRNPITIPTTTLSAEIWVKTTDSESGIISYNSTGVDNAWLSFNPANLNLYVGAPNNAITGVNIATGTWKQVVRTSNRSTGQEIIYVNGIVAFTGTINAGTYLVSGGSLVLGQEQDSVGGGFDVNQAFNGNIASFKLYDKVLSAAEVAQNFNATRGRFGV